MVTNSAASDVTAQKYATVSRTLLWREPFTATQDGGASNRARIAGTDGSATFSFEIRLHKLPHARAMYKFDAHWRAAASLGARLDFTMVDILDAMFQSEQSFPHYKFGQIPAKVHRCSQP